MSIKTITFTRDVRAEKWNLGLTGILNSVERRRMVRFSVGTTLAMAIAFAINWPLSFLLPVFTVVILSLPLPGLSIEGAIKNIIQTLLAFGISLLLTLFLMPFPLAYLIILPLTLFHTYYYLNRGGSFWFVLLLLISLLLLPMLNHIHGMIAEWVSVSLIGSSWGAVIIVFLSFYLVPERQPQSIPSRPEFKNEYSPMAANLALRSTAASFPLALFCITTSMNDLILPMIFAAIFTLSPQLSKGKESFRKSLIATLIGGIAALFFYWLLAAIPEFLFFVILSFLFTLVFGWIIFSAHKMSPYASSAVTAMIILFSGSIGEDEVFLSNFIIRLLMVAIAGLYVMIVLKLLEHYFPLTIKQ